MTRHLTSRFFVSLFLTVCIELTVEVAWLVGQSSLYWLLFYFLQQFSGLDITFKILT